ncbi:MAG: sulfatase [DPANN group archaeon]|nr:sulfatase [DPANN group archaeon]
MKKNFIIIFSMVILVSIIFLVLINSDIGEIGSGITGEAVSENDLGYKCPNCNVIIITIDTLRADHLGTYGYERNTSPNIDALAKEGVLFEQAVTQWPKTSPSIAAMLTGTYGHTNGVMRGTKRKINENNTLLAEVLKEHGYITIGVVSNGNLNSFYNFNQGMDEHIFLWDVYINKTDEAYRIYSLASDIIDNMTNNKFFLWVHSNAPHAPYKPPSPFNESFIDDDYYRYKKLKINFGIDVYIGGIPSRYSLRNNTNLFYYIAQYDGEILFTDYYLKKLLDKLNLLNIRNKTLIILTADHGESLGDHNYYFAHGRLPYDASSRVPLIISYPPGIPENKLIKQPVGLIDIMPTILDFLNISIPDIVEGESLMPFILNSDGGHNKYVFSEAGSSRFYIRSIRDERWKLIFIPSLRDIRIMKKSPFELYDIKNDPNETKNLFFKKPFVSTRLLSNLIYFILTEKDYMPESPVIIPEKNKNLLEQLKSLGYLT